MDTLPPQVQVMQLLLGKFISQSLSVAAELSIADHLKDGSKHVNALAEVTSSNPDGLYRVLRALAAVGVFKELSDRRFENSPLSEVLRGDVQGSLRSMVRWINEPCAWSAWGELGYSVKHGAPAFDHVFGMPVFEYFAKHDHTAKIFNEAMTGFTGATGHAAAESYDFSQFQRVVDIGGGHGALALAILRRHPSVRATVFDLPFVIEGTQEIIAATGMGGTLEAVAGDFFQAVPQGADCYVMKHIIHDWSDEAAIKLLHNCRAAMDKNGRVLVIEQVLTDAPEGAMGKLIDLEMLVMTPGGRERTASEFASLFERAGLKLSRVVPTPSPVCVIEAIPA